MPLRLGAAVIAAAAALSLVGCKTFSDRTRATRTALDAHNLDAALKASNSALGVRRAEQVPEPLEKNDALLLLDRAMVLQARGEYRWSSRDFEVADKALEILDFSRTPAHEIARYLFTDSAGPYKARPYEKLMLNSLNMANYLTQQNLEGARVEARRFTVMRNYLIEAEKGGSSSIGAAGTLGSYLAGYSYEKSRSFEDALRYYDEALETQRLESLAEPVRRLMGRSSYRTQRLESVAKDNVEQTGQKEQTQDAEVLILVSYGRIPALVARRVPIGLALTVAAAFLPPGTAQQARRLAGQGLVTWVNFPELPPGPQNMSVPLVRVGGSPRTFESLVDVDAVARQAWEQSKGRVMAAAVIRMVTRAAIGAGVGVAAGKASNQSGLGVLAALVTQAGLAAGDKPDTRSWATLPARIGVVRLRLPPGTHRIEVEIRGRLHSREVTLEAGQWALVDIVELSRG